MEGISPAAAGSMATAARRLRARLLKVPSMMWWLFCPASCLACRVMSARRANAPRNSSTSWVSKVPTFSVGMARSQHSSPRPERSTAVRISASSMGRAVSP